MMLFGGIVFQVQRLTEETEMMFEAQEQARRLTEKLTAAENKCAELESKVSSTFQYLRGLL